MAVVWLWDAPGPASSWSGITDDEHRAKAYVTALMRCGAATAATVQKASAVIGADLGNRYEPVGAPWHATAGNRGRRRGGAS